MILRDRVTIRDNNGDTVAEHVPAHVQHQTGVEPRQGSGIGWAVIEQATALLPAGTPWGTGSGTWRLTVEGDDGGEYVSDGPAMPRRRNGRVHHITVPLTRWSS